MFIEKSGPMAAKMGIPVSIPMGIEIGLGWSAKSELEMSDAKSEATRLTKMVSTESEES
jgi:hypothetical protein